MLTFVFPGQGSQARGMGGALFDAYPALTAQADEILGYSIKELCLQDRRKELGQTAFTQPALFVVNALHWQRRCDEGQQPDFLAGHSLGEFNALLAAGCFDFGTGLELVRKRAQLMSQAPRGAMAAILNGSRSQVEAVLRDNGLDGIDVANDNGPTQLVISGLVPEMARAQHCFKGELVYYPLNTSGAFHSRYMGAAQAEFAAALEQVRMAPPRVPVIANVTARPYEHGAMGATLAAQIGGTVRWRESVQFLLAQGEPGSAVFEELGHGDVLTKLIRTISHGQPARPAAPPPPALRCRQAAAQRVAEWNRHWPPGTPVTSSLPGYDKLETKSRAVLLFGHRAAVYVQGWHGYFDLDQLTPPQAPAGGGAAS